MMTPVASRLSSPCADGAAQVMPVLVSRSVSFACSILTVSSWPISDS